MFSVLCLKVQPSSSRPLSALKRYFLDRINSKTELLSCSAAPVESKLRFQPTCYLPERSHLIHYLLLLPGPLGPLTPGLSSSVPDWVSFALRLRLTSRRGLVHIQTTLDHNRDYYYSISTITQMQPIQYCISIFGFLTKRVIIYKDPDDTI